MKSLLPHNLALEDTRVCSMPVARASRASDAHMLQPWRGPAQWKKKPAGPFQPWRLRVSWNCIRGVLDQVKSIAYANRRFGWDSWRPRQISVDLSRTASTSSVCAHHGDASVNEIPGSLFQPLQAIQFPRRPVCIGSVRTPRRAARLEGERRRSRARPYSRWTSVVSDRPLTRPRALAQSGSCCSFEMVTKEAFSLVRCRPIVGLFRLDNLDISFAQSIAIRGPLDR